MKSSAKCFVNMIGAILISRYKGENTQCSLSEEQSEESSRLFGQISSILVYFLLQIPKVVCSESAALLLEILMYYIIFSRKTKTSFQ